MKWSIIIIGLIFGSMIQTSFSSDNIGENAWDNLTKKIDDVENRQMNIYEIILEFQDKFLKILKNQESISNDLKMLQTKEEAKTQSINIDFKSSTLFIGGILTQIYILLIQYIINKTSKNKKISSTLNELEETVKTAILTFDSIIKFLKTLENKHLEKDSETILTNYMIRLQILARKLEIVDQLIPHSNNLSAKISNLNFNILTGVAKNKYLSIGNIIKEENWKNIESHNEIIKSNFEELKIEIDKYLN